MMTKTFWISLVAAGAVSAIILASQRGNVVELREQVTQLRSEVEEMEAPDWMPTKRKSPEGGGDGSKSDERSDGSKSETPTPTVTKGKIEIAQAKLESLLSGLGNINESPAEFMRILPDVLEAIQDLNVEEMLALSRVIGDESNRENSGNFARMILIMLASEYEPQRILNDKTLPMDMQFRTAALGSLARKDPKAAKRWFDNADLLDHERRQMAVGISMRLMQQNVAEGLDFLRDLPKFDREQAFAGLAMMLENPAKVDALFRAVQNEQDEDFKGQLAKSLIAVTVLKQGLPEGKAMLDRLSLGKEERFQVVSEVSQEAMEIAPAEMISWVLEESAGRNQAEIVGNIVQSWAYKDFNAAAKWLGTQEPGPIKNQAISQFANTVVQVDPTAALTWVGEITDEELQKSTTRNVLMAWSAKDRPAVQAWLAERGMPEDEWIGSAAASDLSIPLQHAKFVTIIDPQGGETKMTPEQFKKFKEENDVSKMTIKVEMDN